MLIYNFSELTLDLKYPVQGQLEHRAKASATESIL